MTPRRRFNALKRDIRRATGTSRRDAQQKLRAFMHAQLRAELTKKRRRR